MFNVGDTFLNIRCDEIVTIIRMTDKVAFLSGTSAYGTFEMKKSISTVTKLINTRQWETIKQ